MTARRTKGLLLLALCGALAACAHRGAPPPAASQAPSPAQDAAAHARASLLETQRALKALGYDPGTADGLPGPKTTAALRAFQAGYQMPVDGKLSESLARKIVAAAAKLPNAAQVPYQFGDTYVYSDGASEQVQGPADSLRPKSGDGVSQVEPANYLLVSAPGVRADAPRDFLQPLKPGAKGEYKLFRKAPDAPGESVSVVACDVGALKSVTAPVGTFDTLEVSCREIGGGQPSVERRWSYAPTLRHVVRETTVVQGEEPKTRTLVAIRPATDDWPSAARAGLDWAVTDALEKGPQAAPVAWSSTGVTRQYTVQVLGPVAVTPAFVPATPDAAGCLRYAMVQTDAHGGARSYPGVACKSAQGKWIIPGQPPYVFATAPSGSR